MKAEAEKESSESWFYSPVDESVVKLYVVEPPHLQTPHVTLSVYFSQMPIQSIALNP